MGVVDTSNESVVKGPMNLMTVQCVCPYAQNYHWLKLTQQAFADTASVSN